MFPIGVNDEPNFLIETGDKRVLNKTAQTNSVALSP
jgi:hypothetical protein